MRAREESGWIYKFGYTRTSWMFEIPEGLSAHRRGVFPPGVPPPDPYYLHGGHLPGWVHLPTSPGLLISPVV